MPMYAQGSEEWLRERATVITATECSALEGINPWTKPMEVVRQKVRALSAAPSEFKMSPPVLHGQKTEPYARAWYEAENEEDVIETGMVRHASYSFLGASPDGLVGMDGILEIKCPFRKTYSIYDKDKQHYLWQVYMQMECLDLDWCDFVCYLQRDNTQEPTVTVERVDRKRGWLEEKVSGELCPQPREGDIRRVDLYQAWHNYIHDQFQTPELQKVHIDPIPDLSFTQVDDEQMNELAKIMKRIQEIESRNEDDLAALEKLRTRKEDLKKQIVARHEVSVTNGLGLGVKVVKQTPPVDYKKVYDFMGGDEALKEKGEKLDSFRKKTNTHRSTVVEI